jgi:hypothetical protein
MGWGAERSIGQGTLTSGVGFGVLVEKTVGFIQDQLLHWRDDPARLRADSEERLNAQLCKFLNACARGVFPMVCFHHEERQAGRRRTDLSALPAETIWAGTRAYTVYDPLLVIEGKRLPAPSASREQEYVTGLAKRTGGIQRFKLGLHGAELRRAVIVGYIQEGRPPTWRVTINGWITALAAGTPRDVCRWTTEEQLGELHQHGQCDLAACVSAHPRVGCACSADILLDHLWVVM